MRWKNVVLGMPVLWTFLYCKPLPSKPEPLPFISEGASNLEPRFRSQGMRYLEIGQKAMESSFPLSSNVQSLFLERCADLPLRIRILRTNRDYRDYRLLADRLSFLHLFPSQRIRQLSVRTHDLDEEVLPRKSLLSTLFNKLNLLMCRLQNLLVLELIDLSADTSKRFTKAVFHRDPVRDPNDWLKLLKVEIHGEPGSVWYDLLAGDPSRLTYLTISNTELGTFRQYPDLFDLMGSSLTHLKVANVSWEIINWDDLFTRLTNLRYLRLEVTIPVIFLLNDFIAAVDQAACLGRALLDKLPTVVNSLTRLSEIELITTVPIRARGLILFLASRLESVEVEAGQFRVVVSRPTFTPSEINSLRGVATVEIV
jgi:hypothetical protein